jgi:hypothetical protein
MTTIGTQGLVDDGSANLTVGGSTVTNVSYMTPNVLPGTASNGSGWPGGPSPFGMISIPTPGFFQVPVSGSAVGSSKGMGGFTGSLPSAATYPGGEILITDTAGLWSYLLSGSSISLMGNVSLNSVSSSNGTRATVSPGGTIGLWSDSKGWVVCAISGTCTLAP